MVDKGSACSVKERTTRFSAIDSQSACSNGPKASSTIVIKEQTTRFSAIDHKQTVIVEGLCLVCGVGGLSCVCGVSAKYVCHEKCNVVMNVHPSDTSAIATATTTTTTTTNNDNKQHIDEPFVVESPMFPHFRSHPARNLLGPRYKNLATRTSRVLIWL